MARLTVVEGARGGGKSLLARRLRDRVNYSTLINFTGFPDKGAAGHKKVADYYNAFIDLLAELRGKDYNFICDRMFFSEMVYSRLYKDYDFRVTYNMLADELARNVDRLDIFYLTVNDSAVLEQRLVRDKVPFATAVENVEQSLRQQEAYDQLFFELDLFYGAYDHIGIHKVDTTMLTPDDVFQQVLGTLRGDEF